MTLKYETSEKLELVHVRQALRPILRHIENRGVLSLEQWGIESQGLEEEIRVLITRVERGIEWETGQALREVRASGKVAMQEQLAVDGDGDPVAMVLVPIQRFAAIADAERACVKLRAEVERMEKRNNQMAATAQDGIDQRDALRKEKDKWERYYRAALKDDAAHIKENGDLKAELDQTKEEVEHLRKQLREAQCEIKSMRKDVSRDGEPTKTAWGDVDREGEGQPSKAAWEMLDNLQERMERVEAWVETYARQRAETISK